VRNAHAGNTVVHYNRNKLYDNLTSDMAIEKAWQAVTLNLA